MFLKFFACSAIYNFILYIIQFNRNFKLHFVFQLSIFIEVIPIQLFSCSGFDQYLSSIYLNKRVTPMCVDEYLEIWCVHVVCRVPSVHN